MGYVNMIKYIDKQDEEIRRLRAHISELEAKVDYYEKANETNGA